MREEINEIQMRLKPSHAVLLTFIFGDAAEERLLQENNTSISEFIKQIKYEDTNIKKLFFN